MKTVVVRAPMLTMSGYGVHSRQIFRWLSERGGVNLRTDILKWGQTSWILNPEYENGLIGKMMKASSGLDIPFDVSFQLQLPNEWDPNLATYNVGVSAVVETDTCNPEWVCKCNKMDAIVVPSQHTANVLKNTGNITVPLYVIGESFIDECITAEPANLDINTDFNFLMLGQLTDHSPYKDRKNVLFTLKWLCEEFKDDVDVGIIIKTNSGRGTKIDRSITRKVLQNALKEVRLGPYPKVHFIHGHMSSKEVAGLYLNDKVKALITATRGEGFGLPLLEAAACGLPVIAPNWSGHKDFLDLGKWLKVDYTLQDIPDDRADGGIFIKGSKWAEPNEESFKAIARKFYKKPSIPSVWAKNLKPIIHEKYSFKVIADIYEQHFKDIL